MISGIPRRIIHVWGGGERDLSLASKAAIVNVKSLNPDFEYMLFDDDQIKGFINKHYPEYQNVFLSFREPIQRYDFFRYLAIYHFGGFYLDLDVFLVSSLSDLLKFGCVFSFEELTINSFLRKEYGLDWEIANYAFGAAAGHPFIHAVIKNCVRAQRDSQWADLMLTPIPWMFRDRYHVLYTTGPGLVSRTLAEYPDAAKEVKVLFPKNVCNKNNWYNFGEYGVHLHTGKWRPYPENIGQHFLRYIRGKWFARLLEKQMKASIEKGPERSL